MLKKGKLSAIFFITALLFAFSLAFAENKAFKNYAIGFDSTYTFPALYYGGFGGGFEAEMLASGVISLAADFGYEYVRYNETGATNNNQLIYASIGGRLYMSYDAIKGPFLGLLVGVRFDIINGVTYPRFIAPLEFGWKIVFDNTGGLYIEPLVKVVMLPYYDSVNVSLQNEYALLLGVNIGAAF